uniref:G-protein coupled receptors family 1 profile domain-containing protein n=1 Tax=Chelonoidis abingdonii TaxID=106734 RepID=A0A8C0IY45_CHEAB
MILQGDVTRAGSSFFATTSKKKILLPPILTLTSSPHLPAAPALGFPPPHTFCHPSPELSTRTRTLLLLLGNFTLLCVVGKEQTLHKPMYLLLCMLALTDIATPTFVVPKALGIFWFNLKGITMAGCLSQMFFLHMVSVIHSATLVTMAFDRYVAICIPLRYATILTNAQIAKFGLVGLLRAVLFILPLPLLMSQQPFCANRIIPHTQCEYIALFKMACGDITVTRIFGLVLMIVINGFDLMLIALSYGLIIRAVLRMSSKNAHQKALNTCTTHICVIFFSNLTYRFGQGIAPHVHIILADLYLLIPPMLNPIIYGIRTKELNYELPLRRREGSL